MATWPCVWLCASILNDIEGNTAWDMAMSLAVSLYVFLGRMQHGQGHGRVPLLCFKMQAHDQIQGRVSGRVCTAVHQNHAFFDAATLATKATTFVTMHILNYNICNTYFSIQNNTQKNQMITTLAITHMLQSHNTCKFENIQLQHLQLAFF